MLLGDDRLRAAGGPARRLPRRPLPRRPCAAGRAPKPVTIPDYQPVTAETLTNPADGDWPGYRRTYDGWGYSPLDQITPRTSRSSSRPG